MTPKYLLLDTSIFIDCLKRERSNDDIASLKSLLGLLDESKVFLLLPEIIQIETIRIFEKEDEEFSGYSDSKATISMKSDYHKAGLIEKIEEFKKDKGKEFHEIKELVGKIFNHKGTKLLNTDFQIFYQAYKRGIAGKKPFKPYRSKEFTGSAIHDVQPDCLIIEMSRHFLSSIKDYELFFATMNISDFCMLTGDKKVLHTDITDDFKHIEFFESLSELLNKEFKTSLSVTSSSLPQEKLTEDHPRRKEIEVPEIITALEYSSSFEEAEENIKRILRIRSLLTKGDIENLLTAILANPNSYTVNQILSVESRTGFLKRLYMFSSEHKAMWRKFAENLSLYLDDDASDLLKYNWLFDRLGMTHYFDSDEIPDEIPF